MLPRYFLILACLAAAIFSDAQHREPVGCDTLASANEAWCRGDTVATVTLLETLDRRFPDSGLSVSACLILGEIYLSLNRVEDARRIFEKGIARPWTLDCLNGRISGCGPLFSGIYMGEAKPRMWLDLSKIAEGRFETALAFTFLMRADTGFHSGCANATEEWRAAGLLVAEQEPDLHDERSRQSR